MYHYHAFGLQICSDLALIDLQKKACHQKIDVSIQAADLPYQLAHPIKQSHGLMGHKHVLLLNIPEVARFLISDGKEIRYHIYSGVHSDTLRLFLLGSCMGALLQQRGYIVLHGNAISRDGNRCEVFVGHRGAGKSTLAAWHYLQGAYVLTDDVCAIYFDQDGKPWVIPSFPQLKIRQHAAHLLKLPTTAFKRRIQPNDEKYVLSIEHQFVNHALPLVSVNEITSLYDKNVRGVKKLELLVQHSYRYHFLSYMGCMTSYLRKLMQLAAVTRVQQTKRLMISQPCL
ncbi:MAG: hypothetical protein A3F42_00730 [Gammaproteobacteria bacterium RIFCSPHIGHO2_12_FULL_37_34]|nr:MAG: hypothetical protein A3F42_00730 [Gammaproteobacteria bacterium RIFCSPHIGHO2_12_FULL_37_34]